MKLKNEMGCACSFGVDVGGAHYELVFEKGETKDLTKLGVDERVQKAFAKEHNEDLVSPTQVKKAELLECPICHRADFKRLQDVNSHGKALHDNWEKLTAE